MVYTVTGIESVSGNNWDSTDKDKVADANAIISIILN